MQEVITRAGLRVLRTTRTTIAPNGARVVSVNERILGPGESASDYSGQSQGQWGTSQQRRGRCHSRSHRIGFCSTITAELIIPSSDRQPVAASRP